MKASTVPEPISWRWPICAPTILAVWLAQMPAMRTDQPRMNLRRAALIFVAGIITASCSEKSAPDREQNANTSEAPRKPVRAPGGQTAEAKADLPPPSPSQIERECLALLRSTKVIPAQEARTDCPGCPVGGTEVLTVRRMKTDAVSCSGDTCNAVVTILALFNPGSGETIAGGLTAWIAPEQRSAYLSGQIPSEEQVYRLHITYKHRGDAWQAVEFDRAPVE